MYFEDLTTYRYYLPFELVEVRNVGWIDASQPYTKGEVPKSFVAKLHEIICLRQAPIDPRVNIIRGVHPCCLCGEDHIEIYCSVGNTILGMSEVWLPASKGYFASPSMVLHYIEAHEYAPPQEYVDAVMAFDLRRPFNAQELYDGLVAEQAE